MADGPSYRLFTVEFYSLVRERLNPHGVVVLQSDGVSLHNLESAATMHATVRAVWPLIHSSVVFLPAYTTDWSFTLAGLDGNAAPLGQSPESLDERVESRLLTALRFYDGITHHRLFRLPRYVRDAFAVARSVNRDAQPMQQSFPGLHGRIALASE
jgi:spermidine synthase